MRTKNQIHVLSGHQGTVWGLETQTTDPQIITGSSDSTVKVRDPVGAPAAPTQSLATDQVPGDGGSRVAFGWPLCVYGAVVGLGGREGDDDADEPQEGRASDRQVTDRT